MGCTKVCVVPCDWLACWSWRNPRLWNHPHQNDVYYIGKSIWTSDHHNHILVQCPVSKPWAFKVSALYSSGKPLHWILEHCCAHWTTRALGRLMLGEENWLSVDNPVLSHQPWQTMLMDLNLCTVALSWWSKFGVDPLVPVKRNLYTARKDILWVQVGSKLFGNNLEKAHM